LIKQPPDTLEQPSHDDLSAGPAGQVPWTTQQTLRGVLLTLVPWIIFSLTENALSGSSTSTQSVTLGEDLAGGILAFIITGILEGIFLIAPFYYARKALAQVSTSTRAVLRALALRRFQIGRTLLILLGLLVFIIAVNEAYDYVLGIFHLNIQTNDQVLLQEAQTQPFTVYGLLAGSVLLAPFCEEIFFRGFLFGGLRREFSPLWSILISSALFAIAHVDPGSFVPLFAIGLALGFVRWKSDSTWPGILLHTFNNLLGSVLIVLALYHVNLPF
jgi:membrane protease YdiL (CAAX protease family)